MINLQIVQPAVPRYRVPFFQILQSVPGISLSINSSHESSLAPAEMPATLDKIITYHETVKLFGSRAFWQMGLSLRSDLKAGDVLILSGNPRIISNYPIALAARKKGARILLWSHGWTAGAKPSLAAIRHRLTRFADGVILYTKNERDQFLQKGFNPETTFYAGNTVDQKPIIKAASNWNEERLRQFHHKNAITPDNLLLFSGRITEKTNLPVLIHALSKLKQAGKVHNLCIIGDGPLKDTIKGMAASENLEQNIIWLGSQYNEMDLAPWFLSARGFVYPGAIGLSALHAQWYGLPVITHNNPSNQMPEFATVIDGISGLLFQENDAGSLAESILAITERPDRRHAMSIQARQQMEAEYTIELMVQRFADAVHALANM